MPQSLSSLTILIKQFLDVIQNINQGIISHDFFLQRKISKLGFHKGNQVSYLRNQM